MLYHYPKGQVAHGGIGVISIYDQRLALLAHLSYALSKMGDI